MGIFFFIDDKPINFNDPASVVRDEYRKYLARKEFAPFVLSNLRSGQCWICKEIWYWASKSCVILSYFCNDSVVRRHYGYKTYILILL